MNRLSQRPLKGVLAPPWGANTGDPRSRVSPHIYVRRGIDLLIRSRNLVIGSVSESEAHGKWK